MALLKAIIFYTIIFNKKRVGKLQKMTTLIFMKWYEAETSSQFEKALSNKEKILYKSLKAVVIR